MAWCPVCKEQFLTSDTTCIQCGSTLIADPPDGAGGDPVVVLEAATGVEAQIARATLESEGIPAYVQQTTVVIPQYGNVVDDETPELDVVVASEYADAARAVLSEPLPTDEEMDAAVETSRTGECEQEENE